MRAGLSLSSSVNVARSVHACCYGETDDNVMSAVELLMLTDDRRLSDKSSTMDDSGDFLSVAENIAPSSGLSSYFLLDSRCFVRAD